MSKLLRRIFVVGLVFIANQTLFAADTGTRRQYLSGHDKDDVVPWKFFCTSGAQSGYWTNLPVPSNWEFHGFGTLTYHRDSTNPPPEEGLYEHDFKVPANWSGKRVFLVFEGVMTDTSAKLNGQSVGPMHQGGYYRFKYKVTKLLKFGVTNRLEVTVAKHSANKSVNGAERTGDYWMFGGIYRPVYLEAVPQQFIERVAIDARADGRFSMDVFTGGATEADTIEAQITTLAGKNVGTFFSARIANSSLSSPEGGEGRGEEANFLKAQSPSPLPSPRMGGAREAEQCVVLETQIISPKLWTAETPNLYRVRVRLKQGRRVVHQIQQQFGFRTFEVRDGDGLYLNGRRIVLKGCCRHSFWPDSGRCLSPAVHRLDIETMKDMNMNAVRMSHYPPDAEFLDLCDKLGLYVLDELAGWHKAYDTETGTNLVREMVTRDVNHPSILFWDNGNEGGFNTNLDKVFGEYDPQQRRVLHPWIPFSGVDTIHYPTYDFVKLACEGYPVYFHRNHYFANTNDPAKYIFMPTEFLHGLYDGGAGAGLEDVWNLMQRSRYLGGGFIWAFLDEGVHRTDHGQIDVAGNEAPDGIVGPYRQREASFYTIKKIWSPMVILETNLPENFDGTLAVEDRYSFTDARQCKFAWQLRRFISPGRADSDGETVSAEGVAESPAIPPGGRGRLHLNLPENFWYTSDVTEGDFLAVRIDDPNGRKLWTYVWPLRQRKGLSDDARILAQADNFGATNHGVIELKGNDIVARIDGVTGWLTEVDRAGKKFSLSNGPRLALTNSTLEKLAWQLRDDGWLQCNYSYAAEGTNDYFGMVFDYPENLVKSKRWLGDGPYRVWKNRTQGVTLGVWQNDYNNTITGWRDWIYPEFKGCFANVRWLQLNTSEGTITVVPENVPFVQVLTPEFPPAKLAGNTLPPLPQCGLGLLNAIPPIGSKFQAADAVAPSGDRAVAHGEYSGTVRFYFGKLP